MPINRGDRVIIRGLDLVGTVINIRYDDRNDAIYTVDLDNGDGHFVARVFELSTKASLRAAILASF
jgi:hypothetical protein